MIEECYNYFDRIEKFGGVIPAIERGFFQKEIAESAYRYQKQIDEKNRIIVGVNEYKSEDKLSIPILEMDKEGEKRQINRLNKLKRDRNNSKVQTNLNNLRKAAEGEKNLMPFILDCVHSYATLGETCGVLREVFGEYEEPAIF
jgi:methylmalonyl-CoA mutase N-terminal domain/subunit